MKDSQQQFNLTHKPLFCTSSDVPRQKNKQNKTKFKLLSEITLENFTLIYSSKDKSKLANNI